MILIGSRLPLIDGTPLISRAGPEATVPIGGTELAEGVAALAGVA